MINCSIVSFLRQSGRLCQAWKREKKVFKHMAPTKMKHRQKNSEKIQCMYNLLVVSSALTTHMEPGACVWQRFLSCKKKAFSSWEYSFMTSVLIFLWTVIMDIFETTRIVPPVSRCGLTFIFELYRHISLWFESCVVTFYSPTLVIMTA